MKYIIEDIRTAEERKQTSYLIEDDKVRYVNETLGRLLYKRLNIAPFILSPGKIMHSTLLEKATIQEIRKQLTELIQLGCTTVIAITHLERANELHKSAVKMRHQLVNSAIDYLIGVQLPIDQLTPSFIRACRRENIPLVYVEVTSMNQYDAIAWEWIRDALFHYRLVIVPVYSEAQMMKKESSQANIKWQTIANMFQIPTLERVFSNQEPYDRVSLQKIGIYPLKSVLMVGSDVDYCLAHRNESDIVCEVVVLRGRILKAGERIFYSAGFGREVKVKLPGRFQALASATTKG